jgi:hypothetical protein
MNCIVVCRVQTLFAIVLALLVLIGELHHCVEHMTFGVDGEASCGN